MPALPPLRFGTGVPGSSGSAPDDGARAFLQERLGRFGAIGAAIVAAFYSYINLLPMGGGSPGWLSDPANRCTLGILAVFAGLWAWCRGGSRSVRALGRADMAGTLAVCALCAAHAWLNPRLASGQYVAMQAVAYTLVFRAALLPSPPGRTVALAVPGALLGALPALVGRDLRMRPLDFDAAVLLIWAPVGVVASAATSAIIYGLRRQVAEAQRLGQYVLEGRLGEGGMGEVFRAHHVLLKRPTAVKLIRPDRAGEAAVARFEREVVLTSRLTHPNTVAIYDYGRTPDGTFYYAMELLDGLDLARLVREDGSQPPARVAHLLRQACLSLAEAHAQGLVHRDVKPANLILCERGGLTDVVKVLDFGLVMDLGAGRDHLIVGTPDFMAPEAVEAPEKVDARADLYALGAVGYFLLTGKPVFEGASVEAVLNLHLTEAPLPPSRRGTAVPPELEFLILQCLEKEPSRRPASAAALGEALTPLAAGWTPELAKAWWAARAERTPPADAKAVLDIQGARTMTVVFPKRIV